MDKIKIKEMYLRKDKQGNITPVYVAEDGKEYVWFYQATGNCWMTYVVEVKDMKDYATNCNDLEV